MRTGWEVVRCICSEGPVGKASAPIQGIHLTQHSVDFLFIIDTFFIDLANFYPSKCALIPDFLSLHSRKEVDYKKNIDDEC